ncbi:MAG: RDD family protein [Wolbachia endosymbiont of Menacanthus eurysternus]|nr:MAG: RDD family protein [Wolbachia endosymbiont of Menacanthus eurysternus]
MTEVASLRRRFFAYLIDVVILLIPNLLVISLLKDFPLILYLVYMCINCSYFTYFISSETQATPGQQVMSIYTTSIDGSKIDLGLAFDRSISQFFLHLLNNIIAILIEFFQEKSLLVGIFSILGVIVLLLTFCWYLVACFSQKKQTYHDILFDTVVVEGTFTK